MIQVVDVGGTTIKSALANAAGEIIQSQPPIATPEDLTSFLATLKEIRKQAPEAIGFALSMPGIVDPTTGHLSHGGALRFIQDYPLQTVLTEMLQTSVSVINDAKAAALGEATYGKLAGLSNGLSVVLGTGIGLGILINGSLYQGTGFASGEISFVNVDNKLGIEGIAVPRLSAVSLVDHYLTETNKIVEHGGKYFFQQVERQEPLACQLLGDYCDTLAIQLYNLQTLFAPEAIVIGGGISQQPGLFTFLKDSLSRYGQAIYHLVPQPKVLQSALGNQSNLLGALAHFQQQYPAA